MIHFGYPEDNQNVRVVQISATISTAQGYLRLLSFLTFCIKVVPNAHLYMRKPTTMSLQTKSPFSRHLESYLKCWTYSKNLLKGNQLSSIASFKVIRIDASKLGYGGHLGDQIFLGIRSQEDHKLHINCLELKAVFLAVKHFLSQSTDHSVLIKSDNIAVVQYINKTGRNKVSPTLSSGMRSVAASTCLKAAPEHLGI